MKKIILIIYFLSFANLFGFEAKLEKIVEGMNKPWSLSFIDQNSILFTEKKGKLFHLDLKNKTISEIKHNLSVLEDGQGGLLDVLYDDKNVYLSYSEKIDGWKTSTSVAKGRFNINNIKFKNIFRADPPIDSGYHFGSRIVKKNNHLYVSAGERGKGMIAQDGSKHPGSIIRINLDGSIPKDNPKFKGKNEWLPEIYQIGIRNVQGMCLSPFDNEVYMTNHGAKGGDWFGKVNYGGNYGWDKLYWGGTKYSGLKGGPKWLPGYDKPIKYYVPSIAISACQIYKGDEFKEWNGNALIAALKEQSLRKISFTKNNFKSEDIIFKDKIGRLRDLKIANGGKILILTDQGGLWELSKN